MKRNNSHSSRQPASLLSSSLSTERSNSHRNRSQTMPVGRGSHNNSNNNSNNSNDGACYRKNQHYNTNTNHQYRHRKRAKYDSSSSSASKTTATTNTTTTPSTPRGPVSTSTMPTPKLVEPEFHKLNQSDPLHARRIQQRRRMIAMGKNTVGYDEYSQQVPKHKRRPRCMKHPMTPDHTLDIPTKRWQGLVRAWRRALHQYDPEDLASSFSAETTNSSSATAATVTPMPSSNGATSGNSATTTKTNIQEQQLADAAAQGLQVNLATSLMSPSCYGGGGSSNSIDSIGRIVSTSPTSVETEASSCNNSKRDEGMDELDAWETGRTEESDDDNACNGLTDHGDERHSNDHDDFLLDDDSDDELL